MNNVLFYSLGFPKWVYEILSHPILLAICIVAVGFLYLDFNRKLKNGEWKLSDRGAKIFVVVGVILMVIIVKL